MDFHTLSRKDLQALCKRNRIPANTTNVAMADALQALQSVEGLSEILDSVMVQSPKTNQRSSVHKSKVVEQASPLPRSRRVSAKPSVMDDEEKKEAAEAPTLVNTRRRTSKKEESKVIVGTTTGRRTRQTLKKVVVGSETVSTEVRRSTRRVKGIKMSPLSKEDEEKDVEAEKLEVEAEKKSDEKGQSDHLKADGDQLKPEEEKGDDSVEENGREEKKVQEHDSDGEREDTDHVKERTVGNNKEEEVIAEGKQKADHVENALVENKEEYNTKSINEESTQEEVIDVKAEQEGDKIVTEEMNISVDLKHNDKGETGSVVDDIVDNLEEALMENEEEESLDEEAKQGLSPKTNQRSSVHKYKFADQASPLPRSRRVSAKPPVMDDEEKEVTEAVSLVNTRPRTSKKEESKGIVGTATGRRTRHTLKKVVGSETVSTEMRRSTRRVKGIKMSPLSRDDDEKDVEAEELEVEAEKKSDEKVQSDYLKADGDQLKSEEREAEIVGLESKGDDNVDENGRKEKKVQEHDSDEKRVLAKETDRVEERTVGNNEEEVIAERKQEAGIENATCYVEEALAENKEGYNTKSINEEATQEEAIDIKTEQEGAKIAAEEMNISVNLKHNDKEETGSVVEDTADNVEEALMENEKEESLDEEANQGETVGFKSGNEISEIIIEEMCISVDTKQENVVENVVHHAEEKLMENEEEDSLDKEAKKGETIDFKSGIEFSETAVKEINILVDTKLDSDLVVENFVDHAMGTLEENKEGKAIDEEAKLEETTDFKYAQVSIVDHAEEALANKEDEATDEEAKQNETTDFKIEQMIIADHVDETLMENKKEEDADEKAKQNETIDFKIEQMAITGHDEVTSTENEKEEESINEETKLEESTEQMIILDDVGATLAGAEGEEEEAVSDGAMREETNEFKTEQVSIAEYVEETLPGDKEEYETMDDSVMVKISGHVEEALVGNKCGATIVMKELSISADSIHIGKENIEDGVASVEEKVAKSHAVSEGIAVEGRHNFVNEDSPIKGLITSNCKIMNEKRNVEITEVKNLEMAPEEVTEVVVDHDVKFSTQELLDKTETDGSKNENTELAKHEWNFKPSTESNNNKENTDSVSVSAKTKSNVVKYENLSLRKLKSAYREMLEMKSKGEEKRTALKAVNENCM